MQQHRSPVPLHLVPAQPLLNPIGYRQDSSRIQAVLLRSIKSSAPNPDAAKHNACFTSYTAFVT